ncbi:MAG: endonuclease III [Caldilineaceae bacterium]|nr:endonuclease III [Caldilineaceae bacterium]
MVGLGGVAVGDGNVGDGLAAKAQAVYALLQEHYGEPRFSGCDEPVDELIGTILSANTNDVNSGRAFDQLQAAFGGDWDAVRTAPIDAIKTAIRPAGMYNQKAPAIVATLERIKADRGDYDLRFLAALPVDAAMAYLTSLPGVGHKTASIVLLFCFNRAAFPVDTHIQRISQRLGISGRRAAPDKIKGTWEELMAPATFYSLHIDLIQHGRKTCQAQTPRCEVCPLQALCDYYMGAGEWADVTSEGYR